jgi:hypothetical protein
MADSTPPQPPNDDGAFDLSQFLLSHGHERETQEVHSVAGQIPLTLQPFFKEHIDLNQELVQRFPNMPLMTVIRFRDLYNDGERGVATMTSQDGSASLIVDVNNAGDDLQFAFSYGSMLSLRFHLNELSELDRRAWLDNMQSRQEEIVFLWGESRWARDYIICVPHRYYISLLAFSRNNFEAAVRISPLTAAELFTWLKKFWYPAKPVETPKPDSPPPTQILGKW